MDGLYKLSLDYDNTSSSLVVENSVAKRSTFEEKSLMLWYNRLGHISREMVKRLTKTNILPSLNLDDLGTCVGCIKGKFTRTKKKGATRSSDLLEVIHIDISGDPNSCNLC